MYPTHFYISPQDHESPAVLVRENPVLAAFYFERKWKALLKHVLLGKTSALGKIIDYFARVEFQNRGSPHMHMFLWVIDGPDITSADHDTIVSFIDKHISCSLPAEMGERAMLDLVAKVQSHKHTFTCQKRTKGKLICRFGYPKKACTSTKLITNIEMLSYAKTNYYELQRSAQEVNINAYNPVILKHWQANMDIQLVANAFSAAYYICAYMCKAEPDILKSSLAALFKEISNINLPLRNKLLRIGNCVLKKRTLSAQEAAFRLGNLQLIYSSRIVLFLNTFPLHRRTKILKPKDIIDSLPENSTAIFENNMLDYYRKRPDELSSYCYYSFASWYKRSDLNDNPKTARAQPRFYLQPPLSDIKMQKRVKHAVIRVPKLQEGTEDYYYSNLLLYLPHRNESELLFESSNAKEAFIKKYHLLDKHHLQTNLVNYLDATLARL